MMLIYANRNSTDALKIIELSGDRKTAPRKIASRKLPPPQNIAPGRLSHGRLPHGRLSPAKLVPGILTTDKFHMKDYQLENSTRKIVPG